LEYSAADRLLRANGQGAVEVAATRPVRLEGISYRLTLEKKRPCLNKDAFPDNPFVNGLPKDGEESLLTKIYFHFGQHGCENAFILL